MMALRALSVVRNPETACIGYQMMIQEACMGLLDGIPHLGLRVTLDTLYSKFGNSGEPDKASIVPHVAAALEGVDGQAWDDIAVWDSKDGAWWSELVALPPTDYADIATTAEDTQAPTRIIRSDPVMSAPPTYPNFNWLQPEPAPENMTTVQIEDVRPVVRSAVTGASSFNDGGKGGDEDTTLLEAKAFPDDGDRKQGGLKSKSGSQGQMGVNGRGKAPADGREVPGVEDPDTRQKKPAIQKKATAPSATGQSGWRLPGIRLHHDRHAYKALEAETVDNFSIIQQPEFHGMNCVDLAVNISPCQECHKLGYVCVYRPQKDIAGRWIAATCHNCYVTRRGKCSASAPNKQRIRVALGTDIRFLYADHPDFNEKPALRVPSMKCRVKLFKDLLEKKKLLAWPQWLDEFGAVLDKDFAKLTENNISDEATEFFANAPEIYASHDAYVRDYPQYNTRNPDAIRKPSKKGSSVTNPINADDPVPVTASDVEDDEDDDEANGVKTEMVDGFVPEEEQELHAATGDLEEVEVEVEAGSQRVPVSQVENAAPLDDKIEDLPALRSTVTLIRENQLAQQTILDNLLSELQRVHQRLDTWNPLYGAESFPGFDPSHWAGQDTWLQHGGNGSLMELDANSTTATVPHELGESGAQGSASGLKSATGGIAVADARRVNEPPVETAESKSRCDPESPKLTTAEKPSVPPPASDNVGPLELARDGHSKASFPESDKQPAGTAGMEVAVPSETSTLGSPPLQQTTHSSAVSTSDRAPDADRSTSFMLDAGADRVPEDSQVVAIDAPASSGDIINDPPGRSEPPSHPGVFPVPSSYERSVENITIPTSPVAHTLPPILPNQDTLAVVHNAIPSPLPPTTMAPFTANSNGSPTTTASLLQQYVHVPLMILPGSFSTQMDANLQREGNWQGSQGVLNPLAQPTLPGNSDSRIQDIPPGKDCDVRVNANNGCSGSLGLDVFPPPFHTAQSPDHAEVREDEESVALGASTEHAVHDGRAKNVHDTDATPDDCLDNRSSATNSPADSVAQNNTEGDGDCFATGAEDEDSLETPSTGGAGPVADAGHMQDPEAIRLPNDTLDPGDLARNKQIPAKRTVARKPVQTAPVVHQTRSRARSAAEPEPPPKAPEPVGKKRKRREPATGDAPAADNSGKTQRKSPSKRKRH
ncbi:unnamed protein product [Peniophora sp. CBMAI 1063]|nr:unnamed protein product [Peniophora sp. CBMAI 1063]